MKTSVDNPVIEKPNIRTGIGHQLQLKRKSIDAAKVNIDAAWKDIRDIQIESADEEICNLLVELNELSKKCERLSYALREAYDQNR